MKQHRFHFCTRVSNLGAKNTEVGNGATALHAAVENGHVAAVVALLKGGAQQPASMQVAYTVHIHAALAWVSINIGS